MPTRKIKVLFVDDEKSVRDVVQRLFETKGVKVVVAPNGQTARQQVDIQKFDVAFVDYYLPDENGLQLLQAVKSSCPDTIVVIMTGYASIEMAVEAMRLGAWDYISKPLQINSLSDLLRPLAARALTLSLSDI